MSGHRRTKPATPQAAADPRGESRPPGGFYYLVSDEQLQAFSALTPLQRLQWLDAARRFTLMAQTPETAERQGRLRRGQTVAG